MMDSEHSKASSVNTSFEQVILHPSLNRRAAEFRTSQSLSAVVNAPDKTLSGSLYDYLYNSLVTNGIDENPFVQDVPISDFQPYISRINSLLSHARKESASDPFKFENCSPEKCYSNVDRSFFDPSFQVASYLDGNISTIEELSEQLDLTDLTLFKEISERWPLFFSATKDLSGLRSNIAESRTMTKSLIRSHETTQTRFLEKSLRFLYCCKRLSRLTAVQEKLELLAAVRQAQPTIQQLLNSAMYSSALEIIGKTQKTISQKLHGLACIRDENKQLDGMGEAVSRLIGGEFLKQSSAYIITGVFQHKDSILELVKISHNSEGLRKLFAAEEEFVRVEAIIETVASRGAVLEQLSELRTELEAKLKTEVRDLMTSLQLRTDKVHWDALAKPQLLSMLKTFAPIVEHILIRLSTFGLAIFKRLPRMEIDWKQSYIAVKSAIVSYKDGDENYRRSVVSECNHLENVLINKLLSKAVKGLKSPAGKLTTLPLSEIAELYDAAHLLHSLVAKYIDQRGAPLMLTFQQNEKEYLEAFHGKKQKEIAALLEGETWTHVPIPDEFAQLMLQRRIEAVSSSSLRAEEVQIKAVSSLLMFYKVVYEYVRISSDLHLPLETGLRLVEIFKFFNSRVCQMLLGAGAIALGNLKTISAKHLGLSAQCIAFLLQEIQYIELRLKTVVTDYENQLKPDMDRVRHDLNNHLQELYDKLRKIINDRITAKCESAVKEVKWELMLTQNKLEKDYYSQQIVNDMTGMHTILESILNPEQLLLVFGPILSHLAECLLRLYRSAPIVSTISAQRVRNDSQFFLFNAKKMSSVLQDAVREMEVKLEEVVLERCVPLLTPAAT